MRQRTIVVSIATLAVVVVVVLVTLGEQLWRPMMDDVVEVEGQWHILS